MLSLWATRAQLMMKNPQALLVAVMTSWPSHVTLFAAGRDRVIDWFFELHEMAPTH
jgi:hypothetical protein